MILKVTLTIILVMSLLLLSVRECSPLSFRLVSKECIVQYWYVERLIKAEFKKLGLTYHP
jgi:hypothetical protein